MLEVLGLYCPDEAFIGLELFTPVYAAMPPNATLVTGVIVESTKLQVYVAADSLTDAAFQYEDILIEVEVKSDLIRFHPAGGVICVVVSRTITWAIITSPVTVPAGLVWVKKLAPPEPLFAFEIPLSVIPEAGCAVGERKIVGVRVGVGVNVRVGVRVGVKATEVQTTDPVADVPLTVSVESTA